MLYQKQSDLLARKLALAWTNREIANILGIPPGVVSSKLNGFLPLAFNERQCLERAMDNAENLQKGETL